MLQSALRLTAVPIQGVSRASTSANMLSLQVLVDVNWRPVFWDSESSAMDAIKPYACKADIVKMSDEEAEWLFGIPARDALQHPSKVTPYHWLRVDSMC